MLFLFGTIDPHLVAVCRSLLRPGDRFLDIGANHGAVGLLCAQAVLPAGVVHLIEPQADLCRRIEWSLDQFRHTHVKLHSVGLLNYDGEMPLTVPPDHSGAASFRHGSPAGKSRVVTVREARRFLAELVADEPFGVKLDIEGAEQHVLPHLIGMPNLRFVVFETELLPDTGEIWESIRRAGLQLYGISHGLVSTRLHRIRGGPQVSDYYDLLAFRLGSHPPLDDDLGLNRLSDAFSR